MGWLSCFAGSHDGAGPDGPALASPDVMRTPSSLPVAGTPAKESERPPSGLMSRPSLGRVETSVMNTFSRLSLKGPTQQVQQDSAMLTLPESLLVRIASGVTNRLDKCARE